MKKRTKRVKKNPVPKKNPKMKTNWKMKIWKKLEEMSPLDSLPLPLGWRLLTLSICVKEVRGKGNIYSTFS